MRAPQPPTRRQLLWAELVGIAVLIVLVATIAITTALTYHANLWSNGGYVIIVAALLAECLRRVRGLTRY